MCGEAFGVRVEPSTRPCHPLPRFLQSDGVPPPRGALWTTARTFRAVDEEDALFYLSQSRTSRFKTSNLASHFQTACICTAFSKLYCVRCLLATLLQPKDSFRFATRLNTTTKHLHVRHSKQSTSILGPSLCVLLAYFELPARLCIAKRSSFAASS